MDHVTDTQMTSGQADWTTVGPRGWVLYDTDCGVCARWVPFWAPTLARRGLGVASLQAPWVKTLARLPPDALSRDIRLLFRDGRQLAGADVYRHVMRRLWWAYPLYLLAVAPGLRRVFDRAYRTFADHRNLISDACGLPPLTEDAPAPPVGRTAPPPRRRAFLTAEWRHIVILNYEVDPSILATLVPAGTTLDLWQGRALVSLVGFTFLGTRVLGMAVPLHRNFVEVNLRFYVRRRLPSGEARRGVVFVRELVPRAAIALTARFVYNEPYRVAPMRSVVPATLVEAPGRLTYEWRTGGDWQRLAATASGIPALPPPESETAFITQHHWGYTRQRDGSTVEYEVAHPEWRVWASEAPVLSADVIGLYGQPFVSALARPPGSSLVAEGSPVIVYTPCRIS